MESPISASLGAMGPLLRKLDMLLLEPSEGPLRLHKGARRWTHLLKDDLEEITSYLQDLSEVEDPPLTAKCWMKEVRELSYDIENYIDSFVLPGHVANIKTRSGRRRRQFRIRVRHIKITRLLETSKKLNRRKRVAARISDFRIDAREALERHKRYELHCCAGIRRVLLPAAGRLPATWEEGAGIIIDDRMKKFVDSMADDRDPQLKVVSVVGSEGIGKTTFVKVLYHNLKGQFDCRAFVRLTQKPDIKTVLRDILTQLKQQQPHNHWEDSDLLGKIREHLQYKRYLIVIDDLWSASIWDVISYAFTGGKMCSRIITSTQIEDVALACCYYHSEYVFKMRPLDEDLSRELFFNSLFCPENDFPQQLKDVLNKIVKICGGLPLATTIIARLLATHPVILMEQWTYIYDSLSSKLRTSSSASEGMKLVVNFSYNNLTCHLKMCLLYLSMYPEGYTVCKDDLVKQWVAEGFICGTEGREVETAETYFHELIGRRFLQPECIKYTGEVASCSVHEVVRDLIAQKSLEENFVVVLDRYRRNVSLSENVHRLSLHFPYTKYAMTNIRSSQVRSLSYFGLSKCMPSIREFKLLRVLNLNLSGLDDDDDDIIDLTGISDLLRLRYLKVASDVCVELPKHMGGLRYLETLDISKKVTYVALDIIHLPCLLHLHLPLETNLMDWLDMTGPAASVWSLGKLSNLRYLYLTYSIPVPDHLQRNMEALGSLFRGHGSLKALAFILSSVHKNAVAHSPSEATVTWDWDDFAPLLLERFEWLLHSCSFSRVPKWIGELGNLCILKISVKELMRDGVNILGELPALTTLSLYVKIAPVKRIIFDKAGFSVLKYFKFMCSTVPWLKFDADAMPNLQKLKLGFSAHRVDQQSTVPISIEHLPSLKEISAKVGDASSDAESALTAAVSNHPRNPGIRVQLVDWNSYGHGVWYTVSKQETPLALEEDKIADPEEGLDAHCVPQHKDSRDDQNKEAYVRLSREFDLPPASGTSYHHKSDEYSKHHMLANILLDESAEPTTLDLSLFEDITNNFSTEQEIDQGGFGMVYKGILGDGIVAVKRLCGPHETLYGELTQVVDCLMTVKHSNIVRFLGYWAHMHPNVIEKGRGSLRIEQQDMLLCFEYLHNGSLRRHITEESCGFEWHTRFQIMKGICQGLDCLHENHIIHLHLKPENILLDANMVPKIADYAYARLLGEDRRTATQEIVTSLDYLAPEYYEDRSISVKSDIYSLGVIIMQMVTGHKDHPSIKSVLEGWRSRLESDTSRRHTALETAYRQVILCIEMGKSCMHRDPRKRPCIRDIIDRLAEMETSEGSSVTSGTSSVSKFDYFSLPLSPKELFRRSVEESEASLITSLPRLGKDSLNHHQQIKKSTKGMEAGGRAEFSTPFLSKMYEMVDDLATDAVVAWTSTGTSFVIANQAEFCRDLLPKYFKHNNFSSFVRQLNTYGFRKTDPEQWEFANKDFIRGQRHRLKNIHRRKPIFSHSSHTGSGPLADTETRDYEEEIERLERDNAALTLELEINAQKKKLVIEKRMQELQDKLIFLEDRQKNMMAYVRDIVQAPGFLSSFVQQPDHHGKKRRLPIPISLHQDANTEGNEIVHGVISNPPACRESFDKMESSLNSLENFLREASEAFNISYDDGLPGPSSAVVTTELHSSGESDPHVPSPVSRMHTSSAGAGDLLSSRDVTGSTSCTESPPLPQMQSCTDPRTKVSEIDVNMEPSVKETGLSRINLPRSLM